MASEPFPANEKGSGGSQPPFEHVHESKHEAKIEALSHALEVLSEASLPASRHLEAMVFLSKRVAHLKEDLRAMAVITQALTQARDPRLVQQAVVITGQLKARSAVHALIALALTVCPSGIILSLAVFDASEADEAEAFKVSDAGTRLRVDAIRALGQIHDDRAIAPLMRLLNDRQENYRVRLAAADALGKLGCEQAVNPLLHIATDDQERSIYLKESAIQALGVLGDFRAMAPLIDMLESKRGFRDKFQYLKEKVLEAIGRIGNQSDQAAPKAVQSLLNALRDEAPSIRLAAVEALGWMGDRVARDAVEPLTQCVFDTDDTVAEAAIEALSRVGGASALSALLGHENLPRHLREDVLSLLMEGA